MNPTDPQAEAVWERTLPQIRDTRRNRRNLRIAGAVAACCALAIWLTPQSPEAPGMPTVRIEPAPPKIETMAVMRVDENGTIRLEEIASNELGSFEFAFGQTPLLPSEMAASEIFPEDFPWF
jgi:hypothetical protein